jgi:hypothetical protein
VVVVAMSAVPYWLTGQEVLVRALASFYGLTVDYVVEGPRSFNRPPFATVVMRRWPPSHRSRQFAITPLDTLDDLDAAVRLNGAWLDVA